MDGPLIYELLSKKEKIVRKVHHEDINFYTDELKKNYVHSCAIDEIAWALSELPKEDVFGINNIWLHQPTRKTNLFSPAWGRLCYYAAPNFQPLIIIEAQQCPVLLTMKNSLSLDDQKELDFLREECNKYKTTKRSHLFYFEQAGIRRVQLFRTLPHEIGHWVDFKADLDHLPHNEKEARADRYAKQAGLKEKWKDHQI
jgi:hypothetical protein